MKGLEKVIYVDVDGTLIDFKTLDNSIILQIFYDSKVVKKIDKLLWWVNDFDVFGYSNAIFYTRMFLYSVISLKNVKEVLKKYEKSYTKYAKHYLNDEIKKMLLDLEKNNVKVVIVTRNMYAKCIAEIVDFPVIVVKNKNKFYSKLYKNEYISYIIGNNYVDDVFSCYLLNMMYKLHGIKKKTIPIYIGKSKIVKKIINKRTLCFEQFKPCLKYLQNVVD